MLNLHKHILIAMNLFLLLTVSEGMAGSNQNSSESYYQPEQIINFAKKVEQTLAQKGARVAIIARAGRPREQLPEGIQYTHTGIAVYSQITVDDGRTIPGYAIYNLYQRSDKPDKSELIQDFPVDFFSGIKVLEAGIIIPSPELQHRMLKVIHSGSYKRFHNPEYSVMANPFTLKFQNCTEHTLDIITAAIYNTNDLAVIKVNEQAYFKPQPVKVNSLVLTVGSMFLGEIATSDHTGSPATATFTTIADFLASYNAAEEVLIITPES